MDHRAERGRDSRERLERVSIEMRPAFRDLSHHDGGKKRMLPDEAGHRRDCAFELFGRTGLRGANDLQALGRESERAAHGVR